MSISERVEALREMMRQWGWQMAIISGSDPHNSEYTPSRWRQRAYISGFTGSSGCVVITLSEAGLWTDSRYFIQATKELAGSGVELHKLSQPDSTEWIEWIGENLSEGGIVGIDGLCVSGDIVAAIFGVVARKSGQVVSKPDFLDTIWSDRPLLPLDKVWIHKEQFAGRSVADKLEWLRREMTIRGCDTMLVSCLDQIAWLLNIRSGDVAYCPFVISYLIIYSDSAILFVEEEKIEPAVASHLAMYGVSIAPYSKAVSQIGGERNGGRIFIDSSTLNYQMESAVNAGYSQRVVRGSSPIELEKAIKNRVEIEGFKQAYIRDGVAQTQFFHWLEDAMLRGDELSECQVSDKLHEFRLQQIGFIDESFHTISAYGENAALPHYSAIPGSDSILKPCGLYLVDSGAHYDCGTTDITRTVPLGPTTDIEKTDYTLCMKAMISLATAIFPEGTPGCRLDAVCRAPLWMTMRNYGHGTGHGVGNLLSVHEGPQTIRQNMKDQPLMVGMITSDEPGVYREGSHGIRHENMIVTTSAGENEFGRWLRFETITRTYLDTSALKVELLTEEERNWINRFNRLVYDTLSTHLSADDREWLRKKCESI